MNNTNYFYIDKQGNQQGPRSLEQLMNSCVITPDTMVWCEGMANWDKASNMPDFNDILNQKPPIAPPIPVVINNNFQQPPMSKPRAWLIENILATLFCCFAFGVAGIIYASKVDNLWMAGKYEEARSASSTARLMLILSVISCAVGLIVYFVFFSTIMMNIANFSTF